MPNAADSLRRPLHRLHQRLQPMTGRDPHERHRSATTLELFFDLTFVIAFAQASTELAHFVAEGYYGDALFGFSFTMFAVIWAWINFTWFASAFDCDDWVYRVTTLVQMLGVLILAMGVHDVFASIHEGGRMHNGELVLGYVVMRLAMVFQWLRVARQDPRHRRTAYIFALAITVAQVLWVTYYYLDLTAPQLMVLAIPAYLVELLGPYVAERNTSTPWHAHHIAERYSLLTIIALGEGVLGSFIALQVAQASLGWTWEVVMVGLGGVALTFGLWWVSFMLPAADVLHLYRRKSFPWSYGHMVLFAAITAVGAGLHVTAYYIEHVAHIGAVPTVLSVVIPVAIVTGLVYLLYSYLVGQVDPFHYWLMAGTAGVLALAVILAAVRVPVPVCLLVVALAPAVTVVGYEVVGHDHHEAAMRRLHGEPGAQADGER